MTLPDMATIHPERKRRVRQALTIFSIAAWVTGTFLLILTGCMVAEYIFHVVERSSTKYVYIIHGWVYIVFLICTFNLGSKARWAPSKWFTTAIAGVVPFLSFFVEHNRRKEVTEAFQLNS